MKPTAPVSYTHLDDEEYERRRAAARRKQKSKKRKSQNRAVTIIALLAGAVILAGVVVFVVKSTGIFDKKEEAPQVQQEENKDDGLVVVPDLVGKTEDEAKALVEEVNLGKQMVGEEASDQEKGKISSQDIPAGTKVEAYTTLKYYVSKGPEKLTIPAYDEYTTAVSYTHLDVYKRQGKKRMDAASFLRGHQLEPGIMLMDHKE